MLQYNKFVGKNMNYYPIYFHAFIPHIAGILCLYHVIPSFNNPARKAFSNNVGKGENAGYNHHFFFFSHNVFTLLTRYHTMPHFDTFKIYIPMENTQERRNCLLQLNFSFSLNVFYHIWHFVFILNALQNVVCNLFQFGPVCHLVMG